MMTNSRSKLEEMDDISESIQIAESISHSISAADAGKLSRSNIKTQNASPSQSIDNKFSP